MMTREKVRSLNWRDENGVVRFDKYKNEYYLPAFAVVKPEKFPRILCPIADETTLHVKALRAAGFEVVTDSRKPESGADFLRMLCERSRETYDAIYMTAPYGAGKIGALLLELIDFGKTFCLFMNFDGLPIARLRYDYIKNNAHLLTMILTPDTYPYKLDSEGVSVKSVQLFSHFHLCYMMHEKRFVFSNPQVDLFGVIDTWQ